MQGVPDLFSDKRDQAQFRHLPALPGVELYHAHITRHAFDSHTHDAYGIGAIISGAQRFRYKGQQQLAPAASLVMMNPDELHTGEAACEQGWQYRMIYFEPALLEALTGRQGGWFTDPVRYDPDRARTLSQLIARLWQTEDTLAHHSLLLQAAETFLPYTHYASAEKTDQNPRFQQVREYLHDNYSDSITLGSLARLASLSRYHFLRQFKAQYHVTPHQMLMAIRLWRAKQYLTQGLPPSEVAHLCGLTDQSHLNRTFALRYGTTPGRYQKQILACR